MPDPDRLTTHMISASYRPGRRASSQLMVPSLPKNVSHGEPPSHQKHFGRGKPRLPRYGGTGRARYGRLTVGLSPSVVVLNTPLAVVAFSGELDQPAGGGGAAGQN